MATDSETAADSHSETDSKEDLPGAGTEDGDRLRAAHAAFERGDYREVRALTEALSGSKEDAVAESARALLRRIQVDPVQVGVILACLALFTLIVYIYVLP